MTNRSYCPATALRRLGCTGDQLVFWSEGQPWHTLPWAVFSLYSLKFGNSKTN